MTNEMTLKELSFENSQKSLPCMLKSKYSSKILLFISTTREFMMLGGNSKSLK